MPKIGPAYYPSIGESDVVWNKGFESNASQLFNLRGASLVRDNLRSEGLIVSDFNDTDWSVVGGTIEVTSLKGVYGESTLTATAVPAGSSVQIDRNIGVNMEHTSSDIALWLHLADGETCTGAQIYLTSTQSTYSSYFQATVSSITTGWNLLRIPKSEWGNIGGESWSNTMEWVRITCNNVSNSVTFGSMMGGVQPKPTVLIEFDDGKSSSYSEGFMYMNKYGIKGTSSIVSTYVGIPDYMSLAEWKSLYDSGWTIGNHTKTHANLSLSTRAEQIDEMTGNAEYISSSGLGDGLNMTYPWGAYNADTLDVMGEYGFKTGREVMGEANNEVGRFADYRYLFTCKNFDETVSLAQGKAIVDEIIANNTTGVLLFHGLEAVAGGGYDWAISDFRELVDYIHATGVDCITRDELFYRLKDHPSDTIPSVSSAGYSA